MPSYPARRDPARAPIHPGEILREDILPALDISVSEAAQAMKISRQTLYRVLSGKAAVSPEMALRLGKFCGNGPDLWLRLQEAHDLWYAERAIAGELAKIKTAKAA
jgi:antitoxin HigA-1